MFSLKIYIYANKPCRVLLLTLAKLFLTDEVTRIDENHLEDKADSINIHIDQLKISAKSASAVRIPYSKFGYALGDYFCVFLS
jgi:hypothetical protein